MNFKHFIFAFGFLIVAIYQITDAETSFDAFNIARSAGDIPPLSSPKVIFPIRGPPRHVPKASPNAPGHSVNTTTIHISPEQRANNTHYGSTGGSSLLQQAMLFTRCDDFATPFDKAYVNWIPTGTNKTSLLQYQLCAAASLQPHLITGFAMINLPNKYGSQGFSARVDICGSRSVGHVPCTNRTSDESPCLTGTTEIPVKFDPQATETVLALLTTPPATTVIRMCL